MERLSDDDQLGSLADSARSKAVKTARTTLIAVGVLTIVVNGFLAAMAEPMVEAAFQKEINQLRQQGMDVDQNAVQNLKEEAVTSTRLTAVGFAGMGVVFLILGAFVQRSPVVCTALGLVLYIAGAGITAMIDPSTIAKGAIIKIIIIVALVKALQAGLAAQREASALEPV